MMVTFLKISNKVMAESFTVMVMSTLAIGKTIGRMALASISMSMELTMKVNGSKTSITVGAKKCGPMVQSLKVITIKARSMDLESFVGQMVHLLREISLQTKWKGMVCMFGSMAANMLETGKTISSTDKVILLGKMAENTTEAMFTTKERVKEFSYGPMVESMTEDGCKEGNTE